MSAGPSATNQGRAKPWDEATSCRQGPKGGGRWSRKEVTAAAPTRMCLYAAAEPCYCSKMQSKRALEALAVRMLVKMSGKRVRSDGKVGGKSQVCGRPVRKGQHRKTASLSFSFSPHCHHFYFIILLAAASHGRCHRRPVWRVGAGFNINITAATAIIVVAACACQ